MQTFSFVSKLRNNSCYVFANKMHKNLLVCNLLQKSLDVYTTNYTVQQQKYNLADENFPTNIHESVKRYKTGQKVHYVEAFLDVPVCCMFASIHLPSDSRNV